MRGEIEFIQPAAAALQLSGLLEPQDPMSSFRFFCVCFWLAKNKQVILRKCCHTSYLPRKPTEDWVTSTVFVLQVSSLGQDLHFPAGENTNTEVQLLYAFFFSLQTDIECCKLFFPQSVSFLLQIPNACHSFWLDVNLKLPPAWNRKPGSLKPLQVVKWRRTTKSAACITGLFYFALNFLLQCCYYWCVTVTEGAPCNRLASSHCNCYRGNTFTSKRALHRYSKSFCNRYIYIKVLFQQLTWQKIHHKPISIIKVFFLVFIFHEIMCIFLAF